MITEWGFKHREHYKGEITGHLMRAPDVKKPQTNLMMSLLDCREDICVNFKQSLNLNQHFRTTTSTFFPQHAEPNAYGIRILS